MTLSAQLFIVDAPASIAGSYDFGETVDFGPDLLDSIWCGELALVEPNEACTPVTNDLTGKIAVIDRGSCNFSLKIYHAQEAGAIAAIIVNHTAGFQLVGMLGGDSASAVVIPAIFMTLEEGGLLKDAIAGGEIVAACMGNIIFDNDIAITENDVTHVFPLSAATVPAAQIIDDGSGVFTALARIANNGNNAANGINTEVTVTFTPQGGTASTVYDESSSTASMLASGDTVIVDDLPVYDFSGSGVGSYTATYSIGFDTDDELPNNNSYAFQFDVSENVYAEGPWDYENNRPGMTFATTILDGGAIEMLSSFEVPHGFGYSIDSVITYVEINTNDQATLDGISITANLYEWIDADGDGVILNDEVSVVATNTHEFGPEAGEGEWVTIPLLNNSTLNNGYEIPEDGNVYFVGIGYNGDLTVEFGFNSNYSFALNLDAGLFVTDGDYPYLQTTSQVGGAADFESADLFTDFFATTSTGLYINETTSSTNELSDAEAKILLFPNPASELVSATLTLEELSKSLTYTITDANGREVLHVEKADVKEDVSEFNISQLPAGTYFLNIETDKGIKTESFNVMR